MKYSVSMYSYSQLTSSGKKTLEDCILLAKEQGFDGVEFVDINPPEGMSEIEYAKVLKEKCDEAGLEVSSYTVGADFLNGSDGNLEREIERVKKKVDVAEVLGVKVMRHDATGGFDRDKRGFRGFDDALPALVRGCREVTAYAKTKGIKTTVENHGFFSQESRRVEKLVNSVADENFGLLIDIGNFACADESSVEAVGRLAPYAFHVHAKDFYVRSGNAPFFADGFFKTRGGTYLRGAIIGHGDIPVYQCLHTLMSEGYDGWITVEFEGMEDCEKGVLSGLKSLKRMIEN
ncbi:MAG: sugar phosphate isomerase/epimerase family protein [Oscillospiraceae bacterium]|nr:sugar phosphate isomerase/epimerase family protein [Oscillospiraceae bacterium]